MLQSGDLINSQPYLLAYRKDILANLSLPVPQTWDQLLQVGQGVGLVVGNRAGGYRDDSYPDPVLTAAGAISLGLSEYVSDC